MCDYIQELSKFVIKKLGTSQTLLHVLLSFVKLYLFTFYNLYNTKYIKEGTLWNNNTCKLIIHFICYLLFCNQSVRLAVEKEAACSAAFRFNT